MVWWSSLRRGCMSSFLCLMEILYGISKLLVSSFSLLCALSCALARWRSEFENSQVEEVFHYCEGSSISDCPMVFVVTSLCIFTFKVEFFSVSILSLIWDFKDVYIKEIQEGLKDAWHRRIHGSKDAQAWQELKSWDFWRSQAYLGPTQPNPSREMMRQRRWEWKDTWFPII